MSKKDLKLEWNVDIEDLSSLVLDDGSLDELVKDDVLGSTKIEKGGNLSLSSDNVNVDSSSLAESDQWSSMMNESVFLDSWENTSLKKNVITDGDGFWTYLRRFYFSSVLTILGVLALILLYLFSLYIKWSKEGIFGINTEGYVDNIKETISWAKDTMWMSHHYDLPNIWAPDETSKLNEIINATDIDYIEKKDLLSSYVVSLIHSAEDKVTKVENLRQDIAKQWFLPEELSMLLSEDQAISTIQRSLSALEVIKFSTATRVFMYMNTALSTISEMIRIKWVSVESLRNLFEKLNWRWEKDISSYVYMCYLNPFEINANCDVVGDLDLYYKIAQDDSIDITLFKNAMNAISQLLEKEDVTLFSITFNWFNAGDENINFNIEVYTTKDDERALKEQWINPPQIFIQNSIIRLLKLSYFIIGAEIDGSERSIYNTTLTQWWISREVGYSTIDFSVPIQKNTEREIFDYIDLDSLKKLLSDRWFKENLDNGEISELDNEKKDIEVENSDLETDNDDSVGYEVGDYEIEGDEFEDSDE